IVDSGGTLCNAADALLKNGATSVTAYITHGVLSGGAVARVTSSKLKELVITDSIQPTTAVQSAHNTRVISTATLLGEASNRTAAEESVSSLFDRFHSQFKLSGARAPATGRAGFCIPGYIACYLRRHGYRADK